MRFLVSCVVWTGVVVLSSTGSLSADLPGAITIRFAAGQMPSESQISYSPPQFGITAIDAILEDCEADSILKYLPYGMNPTSMAGQRLYRTFVVFYTDSIPPDSLVSPLENCSEVESAFTIPEVITYWFGEERFEPSDGRFGDQWSLDYYSPLDRVDIDAPEAWAISRGDPSIVIGIIDSGTMIDTFTTNEPWKLHSDFTYYFNPAEDVSPFGEIDHAIDVDVIDNSVGTDGDDLADNIIGYNFDPDIPSHAPQWAKDIWKAMPHNGVADLAYTDRIVFEGNGVQQHGLHVASIAAAKEGPSGSSVIGVANRCKVYHLRTAYHAINKSPVDETLAVREAMTKCDVINMSWGFFDFPGNAFEDAIKMAAEDYDCVLVAAAGNFSRVPEGHQGSDTLVAWPARYGCRSQRRKHGLNYREVL